MPKGARRGIAAKSHEIGAENRVMLASLIANCKMYDISSSGACDAAPHEWYEIVSTSGGGGHGSSRGGTLRHRKRLQQKLAQ